MATQQMLAVEYRKINFNLTEVEKTSNRKNTNLIKICIENIMFKITTGN